jgi:poly-gamma-glutamate synthesis protein (capsule biosynthesis protein)
VRSGVLALALLVAGACRYQPVIEPAVALAETRVTTTTTTTTTTVAPASARWRLFAAGDVKIDADDISRGPFGAVRPALGDADLSIVNLEMAMGDPATAGTAATKSYTFLGPLAVAGLLARAGVDVVSVANNHALDYGPGTLLGMLTGLRDAGVAPVGAGVDDRAAYAAVTKSVAGGGVRVAVVAATAVWPEATWGAKRDRPGMASGYDVNRFAAAVRAARAGADVVVAFVHWGEESKPCPNGDQLKLGRAVRAAGATAVIGSHPHVLQPLVQEGTMTDTPGVIAYSLGNFVFDRRTGVAGDTVVLELVFEGARLVDVKAHPHTLDSGRPRPAARGSDAATRIAAALSNPCVA